MTEFRPQSAQETARIDEPRRYFTPLFSSILDSNFDRP